MIEVVVDPVQLKKVGEALTDLEAQRFIKPELPPFGRMVVQHMQVYPAEGLVLKSSQQVRSEKAAARALGNLFGFGSLAVSMVSNQIRGGRAPRYKRTQKYQGSWTASLEGLGERIMNRAEYAGYVGGLNASPGGRSGAKGDQPYTWRYGWKRLTKVADEVMDEWIPTMESKAFRLWER